MLKGKLTAGNKKLTQCSLTKLLAEHGQAAL